MRSWLFVGAVVLLCALTAQAAPETHRHGRALLATSRPSRVTLPDAGTIGAKLVPLPPLDATLLMQGNATVWFTPFLRTLAPYLGGPVALAILQVPLAPCFYGCRKVFNSCGAWDSTRKGYSRKARYATAIGGLVAAAILIPIAIIGMLNSFNFTNGFSDLFDDAESYMTQMTDALAKYDASVQSSLAAASTAFGAPDTIVTASGLLPALVSYNLSIETTDLILTINETMAEAAAAMATLTQAIDATGTAVRDLNRTATALSRVLDALDNGLVAAANWKINGTFYATNAPPVTGLAAQLRYSSATFTALNRTARALNLTKVTDPLFTVSSLVNAKTTTMAASATTSITAGRNTMQARVGITANNLTSASGAIRALLSDTKTAELLTRTGWGQLEGYRHYTFEASVYLLLASVVVGFVGLIMAAINKRIPPLFTVMAVMGFIVIFLMWTFMALNWALGSIIYSVCQDKTYNTSTYLLQFAYGSNQSLLLTCSAMGTGNLATLNGMNPFPYLLASKPNNMTTTTTALGNLITSTNLFDTRTPNATLATAAGLLVTPDMMIGNLNVQYNLTALAVAIDVAIAADPYTLFGTSPSIVTNALQALNNATVPVIYSLANYTTIDLSLYPGPDPNVTVLYYDLRQAIAFNGSVLAAAQSYRTTLTQLKGYALNATALIAPVVQNATAFNITLGPVRNATYVLHDLIVAAQGNLSEINTAVDNVVAPTLASLKKGVQDAANRGVSTFYYDIIIAASCTDEFDFEPLTVDLCTSMQDSMNILITVSAVLGVLTVPNIIFGTMNSKRAGNREDMYVVEKKKQEKDVLKMGKSKFDDGDDDDGSKSSDRDSFIEERERIRARVAAIEARTNDEEEKEEHRRAQEIGLPAPRGSRPEGDLPELEAGEAGGRRNSRSSYGEDDQLLPSRVTMHVPLADVSDPLAGEAPLPIDKPFNPQTSKAPLVRRSRLPAPIPGMVPYEDAPLPSIAARRQSISSAASGRRQSPDTSARRPSIDSTGRSSRNSSRT